MNHENIELFQKLVGFSSDVNFLLEKNNHTIIEEVYGLNGELIKKIYGTYNSSTGLLWIQKDKWTICMD